MNNLDFLILDCLKTYEDNYINLFSSKSMESISPITPAEISIESPKARFNCPECSQSFRGNRELKRHQRKYNETNKHSCTAVRSLRM
jgi:predicted RNA-binding Zn-ribbon protein involved in translation (DUF1610 family)